MPSSSPAIVVRLLQKGKPDMPAVDSNPRKLVFGLLNGESEPSEEFKNCSELANDVEVSRLFG